MERTATVEEHSYSTEFQETENPISERGRWIGGGAAGTSLAIRRFFWTGGRLWGDIQTAPGLAYGVDEPTDFGDPTAVLTGSWGPSQTATAVVRIRKVPTTGCCHEVEVRLRTTISPQSITGYEAYCSVLPEVPYCHIARWNGPAGSWRNLDEQGSSTYLKDGDEISASVTGTNTVVITLFRNGIKILQVTDTGAAGGGFGGFGPWISGSPGIGFYDSRDDDWSDFGFSSFSAKDSKTELR